ncbi:MAG: hypothetical protein WCT77_12415 [Bacteroidota bacterium]
MGENKYKYKKDRYVRARGGSSRFLSLSCSNCGAYLMLYQKDGSGNLLRLYLDRIFEPDELVDLQVKFDRATLPNLRCLECNKLIGTPMVYEPEKRLAYRLQKGSVIKSK